jgi:para-aminobenzoate synthetase/4-amino-4-deoxychorismate lyase
MQVQSSPVLRFDFTTVAELQCPLVFANPVGTVVARQVGDVVPALREVQDAVDHGLYAAGFVAYEAAPAFDPALVVPPASPLPLVWFGLFTGPVWEEPVRESGSYTVSAWEPAITEALYAADIADIRAGIGSGDFYQVNHTMRLRANFTGDDFAWYERLQAAQRGPYSAYLNLGRYRILSVSPELFFHHNGHRIVTRPMKGTAPRGRWAAEDVRHAQDLVASEKERAENIMIVDMLRNDLGRIARTGSVGVEALFTVERYPTVYQMTSTVAGTVAPETKLAELFTALFPCASVTGAPKISAMRRIAALEPEPRQVYCGAIGYLVPHGPAIFNVGIRTVLLDTATGIAEYGVGSGITWDSTAAGEYEESRVKAAVLGTTWPDFDLLETLRLEEGVYALLERHIERVCGSADYFGIPLAQQDVREALLDYARRLGQGVWRLRLLVSRAGLMRMEHTPLLPGREEPLRAALAQTPVSRRDLFLYHKTTRRAVYEARRAECAAADETLLWNEEGELTEFTTGNLVLELDGKRWTSQLDCGLLPGTLRAELLEAGEIAECVLHPKDLERATAVWLINSVRDWVNVKSINNRRQ